MSRVFLLTVVVVLVACGGAVDDKQAVILAKQYLEQNNLRSALLEIKSALQSNGDNAEARYLLGNLNIVIGDMEAAEKEFRKAEEAGWDEAESRVGLARALVFRNEFKKVVDEIEIKESYIDMARADLLGLKAFSTAALGDINGAESLLFQGQKIDADAFQVLKTAIQLNLTGNKGTREESSRLISKALHLYADNSELLLLSAYSALQSQNIEVAVQYLETIIKTDPVNVVTFSGRRARLSLARIEISKKTSFVQRNC